MSEMSGKYKQIIEELENYIKEPKELEFVKEKFSDLSMLFIDMIDRITRLTDSKIQDIETKQQEVIKRINSVQSIVDNIESDIYEDDENYEFEIVCPYCNYEFTADIEDESKDEIQCPECHNTIELDWNCGEELTDSENNSCFGSCSHCSLQGVAEDEEQYNSEDESKHDEEEEDM